MKELLKNDEIHAVDFLNVNVALTEIHKYFIINFIG